MSNLTGKDPVAIALHQSGVLEMIRSNAYCNLKQIADPFGKRVDNWTRLKGTKELFSEFESDPAYNGAKPFLDHDLRSEATGKFIAGGGLYAHPDIAIQFAMWCSPKFALWVSRQIRHLLTYGEVNLHYTEWSKEQTIESFAAPRDDIRDLYGR